MIEHGREREQITDYEQMNAIRLVEYAKTCINGASLGDMSTDGARFAYVSEEVVRPDETYAIERDDLDGSLFFTDPGGEEYEVTVANEGEGLQGSGVQKIRTIAEAIDWADTTGEHKTTVTKELANNQDDAWFGINVEFIRTVGDANRIPHTTVKLQATRTSGSETDFIKQFCTIESDPEGKVFVTDGITVDQLEGWGTLDLEAVQEEGLTEVDGPGRLQARFKPQIRVDQSLGYDQWLGLLARPLSPQDLLSTDYDAL